MSHDARSHWTRRTAPSCPCLGWGSRLPLTAKRMRAPYVLLITAPAALGCTGNVSSSTAGGDAEASATHAVVIVERTVEAPDSVHAQASARFVRVAAWSSMSEAFRAIGAALDLPDPGTVSYTHLDVYKRQVAPSSMPFRMYARTRSCCFFETSGPKFVAASSALPRVNPSATCLARRAASSCFARGTSIRVQAEHV